MKIYFAHPCFTEKQRNIKAQFLSRLSSFLSISPYGSRITVVDPFDHAPNIENDIGAKLEMAEDIVVECIRLLKTCDIVIALADDNDTGTAFEAGYAYAVNKPFILISSEDCSAANAMLIGSAKAVVNNILDDEQIKRLVDLIEFFFGIWKASQKTPRNN